MGDDDGAHDGQPQPDADNGAFLLATGEFLEDDLLAAGWQAGSVVADRDLDIRPGDAGGDFDDAARAACISRRFPADC